MSDRLDRRIRELYAELSDATPPLPPMPEPARGRQWMRRLPVIALTAAAVLAAVVATAGVLSLSRSDDSEGVVAGSPTTTSAPATFATTTEALDNGNAADTTGAPGTTLPPIDALSLQCASLSTAMEPALATVTVSAAVFEEALDDLEGELFGLRTVVVDLSPADRQTAEGAIDGVDVAISEARGGFATVTDQLADIDATLTDLGATLADLGAGECGALADLLP